MEIGAREDIVTQKKWLDKAAMRRLEEEEVEGGRKDRKKMAESKLLSLELYNRVLKWWEIVEQLTVILHHSGWGLERVIEAYARTLQGNHLLPWRRCVLLSRHWLQWNFLFNDFARIWPSNSIVAVTSAAACVWPLVWPLSLSIQNQPLGNCWDHAQTWLPRWGKVWNTVHFPCRRNVLETSGVLAPEESSRGPYTAAL